MTELDAWWAEQAARKPRKYQVFRKVPGGFVRWIGASNDAREAYEIAVANPPCSVQADDVQVLTVPASGGYPRGPLVGLGRWVPAAQRVARCADLPGSSGDLGVSAHLARRCVTWLRHGEVAHRLGVAKVPRVHLQLGRDGVVRPAVDRRRVVAPEPEPAPPTGGAVLDLLHRWGPGSWSPWILASGLGCSERGVRTTLRELGASVEIVTDEQGDWVSLPATGSR